MTPIDLITYILLYAVAPALAFVAVRLWYLDRKVAMHCTTLRDLKPRVDKISHNVAKLLVANGIEPEK